MPIPSPAACWKRCTADVPSRFHFVFGFKLKSEPFHVVFCLCLESCRRINRPEAIHFHYIRGVATACNVLARRSLD